MSELFNKGEMDKLHSAKNHIAKANDIIGQVVESCERRGSHGRTQGLENYRDDIDQLLNSAPF